METVTSNDGTNIVVRREGAGDPVVLLVGELTDGPQFLDVLAADAHAKQSRGDVLRARHGAAALFRRLDTAEACGLNGLRPPALGAQSSLTDRGR